MKIKFTKIVVALLMAATPAFAFASNHVSENGALQVFGRALVNSAGKPVQLRGVSIGWHCMWPKYYNHTVVDYLANEWHADIVRAAIGLDHLDISYEKQPELSLALLDSVAQAAIADDIYLLVDFHSHANNVKLAKEFFAITAQKYGKYPNTIFEIWNEPTEEPWSEIKEYANEVIPVIRKYAPQSIIIVPTPRWDQDVDAAADDPVTGYNNIMYSLHYYAATHQDYNRDKAKYAIEKGLPLFMSECAGMVHTGDGVLDMDSWEAWQQLADENNISWIAWSLSDKHETCSMLREGTSADARTWREGDIKPWGVLVRYYLRKASPPALP
jgi:endoglucanase